jgi:hypothetical protein
VPASLIQAESRGVRDQPKEARSLENYTRMTVQGAVSGRHAALVNAAAEILDAMAPAEVTDLVSVRRERAARLNDLVAAVTFDYAASA